MIYENSKDRRRLNKQLLLLLLPFIVLVAVFLNMQINRLISQIMLNQSNAYSAIVREVDFKHLNPKSIENISSMYLDQTQLAIVHSDGDLDLVWDNFTNQASKKQVLDKLKLATQAIEYGKSQTGFWIGHKIKQASASYWYIEHYPKENYYHVRIGTASIWIVIILVFLSLLYLSYLGILRYISKPIRAIDEGIQRILEDDFTFDYIGSRFKDIDQLGQTVTSLKNKLVISRQELVASEQKLSILMDHLNLGVVLINPSHQIELYNPEARNILQLDDKTIGRTFESVIQSYALIDMITQVMNQKIAINDELEIFIPKQKFVDVNIIPFQENPNRSHLGQSVLVLLYDISNIRKLETIRTDFVANASHELRTPVTAIKGFAETLQDGALENPQLAEKFVNIIANESLRLEKLIHDILELSRVEKRSEPTHSEAFDVVKVVDDVIDYLAVKAKVKNIHIKTYFDKPEIRMVSDLGRIRQILINILDNAITYSESGKPIEITVNHDLEKIIFSVRDKGMGIPKEDQKRIFERFYRVDKGRSRNSGGTGLGLSIVKNLVNILEGQIILDSEPGKGTEFTIVLPIDSK